MGVLDGLDSAWRGLQRQYEARKEENRQIQEKIDALENSRQLMVAAQKNAESLKGKVQREKVDGWWNGVLANQVEQHISTSTTRCDTLIRGISEGIGQIDGHLWNLRLRYNYIVGLMSNLENAIATNRYERSAAAAELQSGGGVR